MGYIYDGQMYTLEDTAIQAAWEHHPELLDDDLSDFCDSHIEEVIEPEILD